jgi:hypothetical protein
VKAAGIREFGAPVGQGAAALARVGHGAPGSAVVLRPGEYGP